MTRVFVGIGSNVDRDRHIRKGVQMLAHDFGRLLLSSVYESPAYGFEGDDFYNLVAGFDTALDMPALAARLRHLEFTCGRRFKVERFLPRTLDLDLLLYGDLVRHDDQYDLPRADILRYAFVLCPLAEIAPADKHPELDRTYAELWRDFSGDKQQPRPVHFSFMA